MKAWRTLVILTVALMIAAGPAQADYKSDYQEGLKAAKNGDWAKARQLMQSALAQEPTATARMRTYGTNFIPYVPHHYLGVALAQTNDCQSALKAFNNPANQAVVSKLPEQSAAQQKYATQCERFLAAQDRPEVPPTVTTVTPPPATSTAAVAVADTKPAIDSKPPPATVATAPVATIPTLDPAKLAPAVDALARVDRQIAAIDQRLRAAPIVGSGDATALQGELTSLRAQRTRTASKLAQGRSEANTALLAQVAADAGKLDLSLRTLGERVEAAAKGLAQAQEARALVVAKQRAGQQLTRLDQALAEARTTGINATVLTRATALRAALQQSGTATDRAALERNVTDATKTTQDLLTAIAAAPKPAPDALRVLVAAYLSANYAQAAGWNAVDSLPDDRARAQALLIRAAARWHLYVQSGEQDGKLGATFEADLREAKRLDRTLKPNTAAFSPKLLQRFASL